MNFLFDFFEGSMELLKDSDQRDCVIAPAFLKRKILMLLIASDLGHE